MEVRDEKLEEFGFEEFRQRAQEEQKEEENFVELDDRGKICFIKHVKKIMKGGEAIYLATLAFDGEKKKKWLSRTDRRAISESKTNQFTIDTEANGSRIFLILKASSKEANNEGDMPKSS